MEKITNRAIERLTATDVANRWKEYIESKEMEEWRKSLQEAFVKPLIDEVCKKLLEKYGKE
jgi:hypothetical protein